MVKLLEELQATFGRYHFEAALQFAWSPEKMTIFYVPQSLSRADGYYRLMHEIAHGELGHHSYQYDVELVRLEVAAWRLAQKLIRGHSLRIPRSTSNKHLETYRNWLHVRSRCPTCSSAGLQNKQLLYVCAHCQTRWRVPRTQLCQVQRHIQMQPSIV